MLGKLREKSVTAGTSAVAFTQHDLAFVADYLGVCKNLFSLLRSFSIKSYPF